ncbi:VOC family protein [Sphingobacterium sp. SYP-B4668]|uniref:VOC family protein n=1 Tax=Sphingobacterium sp. SYP-B4668 TaxID=2996035 RepID=UPI0022DE855A|nr:VOC family protein [Sphingobacterium sp. SYP-B4668]
MNTNSNPVVYFEIPVHDMSRAIRFYSKALQFTFERESLDDNEMAYFPFSEQHSGITGALAKGDIYNPTKDGVLIYFSTDDIDSTLTRVLAIGGEILYPRTSNSEYGFEVAEFADSEGNRIGLHKRL